MSEPAVAGTAGASADHAQPGRRERALGYALLAALSYVPLLSHATGRVVVDTKAHLYLDTGRILGRAASMWSPYTSLGTITHQDIGYLFPAGPFYWLLDQLGSPMWVAQRLWLGSIIFGAGLGVLFLLRTLRVRGPGVVVAALLYMLSPYLLQYASRISILLLAWSALPWLVGIIVRALREGGWRYPALFAIVVQIAGSVNATALILAGIAPLLWVVHAVWISREIPGARALRVVGRVGMLTALTSVWWIVSLGVEGAYGLNVLEFTETIEAVATTGHTIEVLRGLGYWFFYGGDRLDLWVQASLDYTQRRWLLVTTYSVPVLAMAAAAFIRWKHKIYFVALIVVGVAIGVGTHPYDDPSPFGAAVKAFGEGSTVGLALRSVGRAVPLVVLGLAVLLGVGANLVARRLTDLQRPRLGLAVCALLGVLALVNLPSLWTGDIYGTNLQRDEDVPEYWQEAIDDLQGGPLDPRILELPGADFAAYRWGTTIVPITPALTDRPFVARELTLSGSEASVDLLAALDRRVQLGVLDPDALAPLAALLSAGDVVLRNDLEVDRFDLVRPRELWAQLRTSPTGLGDPVGYGDGLGPPLTYEMLDARELGIASDVETPPPVVILPVSETRPIVRAESGDFALISGNGDGLVDLAEAGVYRGVELFRYAGSLAGDEDALNAAVQQASVLVITDTNRKRAQRWDNLRDTVGYTEPARERALRKDTADHRLEVFPDAGVDSFTVMEQHGARASATAYGTKTTYLPADRPARAFDGDVATAWRVGALGPVHGERIRVDLDEPVSTGEINLVQPLHGARDRYITQVRLQLADADGEHVGRAVTVDLGPESRTADGQTVRFDSREFSRLEVVVTETNVGRQAEYPHSSSVGFAEIRIPDGSGADVRVREVVRMPTDAVSTAAARSEDLALVYEMTRLRNLVAAPNIAEEEASIVRSFVVPAARELTLTGGARLASTADDEAIDSVLGIEEVTARASERLRVNVRTRASSAIDGDTSTSWSTDLGDAEGDWIEVALPAATSVDRLDLSVLADGRHSVPTSLRIEAGGETRVVDVPEIEDRDEIGATAQQTLTFPPVTGDRVRVTIESVRAVSSTEYYLQRPTALPVAIAELGLPGATVAGGGSLPDGCRDDLLTIDGEPVPLRVSGPQSVASEGGRLAVEGCAPVSLDAGRHVLRAAPGAQTAVDLDQLVLSDATLARERAAPAPPRLKVTDGGSTSIDARVTDAREPFWLVLGESFNEGWHAEVNGRDLGPPQLVDGFANGWRVDPGDADRLDVHFRWAPQRWIWIGLAISGLALLACLVLALRRRSPDDAREMSHEAPVLVSPLEGDGRTASRRAVVATVGGLAVGAAVFVTPWVGLLVGLLTFAALVRPRWRAALAFGAPLMVLVTGAYVVIEQSRVGYPPVFEWPKFFDDVHVLGWLAVALLAADAVVELVRTRRADV